MSETFQPAWWLPGPHLQTLWNPFFRKAPRLERRRERLWLADGDFIDGVLYHAGMILYRRP